MTDRYTPTDRQRLCDQLIRHEGLKLRAYVDTVGKTTIGVGRNLDDKGITRDEALWLLSNDLDECEADLASFPWFASLDAVRQRAVIDLRFNLGPTRFRQFRVMLREIARGDFDAAADAMRDSKWYRQVKSRGPRVVWMLRTGTEPDGQDAG